MKITIEVPDETLQEIVDQLAEEGTPITIDELKANKSLEKFFQADISGTYFEYFEDGLGDVDLAEELGL